MACSNSSSNSRNSSSSSSSDNQRIFRIAVCGCGEIATKAHLPAILRAHNNNDNNIDGNQSNHSTVNIAFHLVALIDPKFDKHSDTQNFLTQQKLPPDIPCFSRLADCLRSHTVVVDAVAICTPPSMTLDLAEQALRVGKHVLIEKPPGDWRRLSKLKQDYLSVKNEKQDVARQPTTILTAYHSAACVGIDHAQRWIQQHENNLHHVHFTWKESVRKWHPGQHWVTQKDPHNTQASCEGVLEMVFNPLSLLVALLGGSDWVVQSSQLIVPSNWETPISGSFTMERILADRRLAVTAEFAWDYEAPPDRKKSDEKDEIWTMVFTSNHQPPSTMTLTDGGSQVDIDGHRVTTRPTEAYALKPEYENLYRQFATLLQRQTSHVDDATPRLLQEIQEQAQYTTGPPYEL